MDQAKRPTNGVGARGQSALGEQQARGQVNPTAGVGAETPAATPGARESGVKETVESILIAFILAFVFRAFVVEAFVIPTGSMATTLLGAHMRFTCRECGYTFDVNYPSKSTGEDIEIPPGRAGPDPKTGRDVVFNV